MKTKALSRLVLCLSILVSIAGCSGSSSSEMSGLKGPLVRDLPVDSEELNPPSGAPSTSPPQAIGFYANGRLEKPYSVPLDGRGFIKIFRIRDRGYATDLLHWLLDESSALLKHLFPDSERMQIGDVSDANGGQLSRHASHQNGLDADVAYLRMNRREMEPEGFGGFDEIFVSSGKVTKNFDVVRNYHLFDILISTQMVGRIFVDAAIKTALCDYAKTFDPASEIAKRSTETLRRLRLEALHDDHFHLRAKCPRTSPDCQTQAEPPAGSGCPSKGQALMNPYGYSEE